MIWIWFDCNKLRCHSPPLQKYQQRPHTLTNTISKWMTMTIYLQGVISSCLEYGLRVEANRGVGFGEYLPIDIKNEWQIISTHLFLMAKETMRMSGLMCWRLVSLKNREWKTMQWRSPGKSSTIPENWRMEDNATIWLEYKNNHINISSSMKNIVPHLFNCLPCSTSVGNNQKGSQMIANDRKRLETIGGVCIYDTTVRDARKL